MGQKYEFYKDWLSYDRRIIQLWASITGPQRPHIILSGKIKDSDDMFVYIMDLWEFEQCRETNNFADAKMIDVTGVGGDVYTMLLDRARRSTEVWTKPKEVLNAH